MFQFPNLTTLIKNKSKNEPKNVNNQTDFTSDKSVKKKYELKKLIQLAELRVEKEKSIT